MKTPLQELITQMSYNRDRALGAEKDAYNICILYAENMLERLGTLKTNNKMKKEMEHKNPHYVDGYSAPYPRKVANSNEQSLAMSVANGNMCFAENSFALVEHKNNDTDEIEYGDVVGETQAYFLVKPHLRKEQNRWLKVDCNIVEYYR